MDKIKLYTCASGLRLLNQGISFIAYTLEDDELPEGDEIPFEVELHACINRLDGTYKVVKTKFVKLL